jgi:hypothetical protein
VYAAKVRRIERQLHHYGSGLNAIPVPSEYRDDPDDLYLLRIGLAGQMGAIANSARLHVEQPAAVAGVGKYVTSRHFEIERDAFVIPLSPGQTLVDLSFR